MRFGILVLLMLQTNVCFAADKASEIGKANVCELKSTSPEKLTRSLQKQGCSIGDILLIRDMGMTAKYMRVVAHVCDFTHPVIEGEYNAICTYVGFVRDVREKP